MRKIAELQIAKAPKYHYQATSARELAELLSALVAVKQSARVKMLASGNLGVYV